MDLKKIVNELTDCLVQARLVKAKKANVLFDDGDLSRVDEGEVCRLSVRVSKGKRSGFAWTNDLNSWKETITRAKKLMLASSELKKDVILSEAPSISKSFPNEYNKISFEELVSKGELMLNTITDLGVNTPQLELKKELVIDEFLNSNDNYMVQEYGGFEVGVECAVGPVSAWDTITNNDFKFDFTGFSERVANLCNKSVNPGRIKPGLFSVVFDFNAVSDLMNLLSYGLMGNNVLKHNSFLDGKQGQKILSDSFSLKDTGVIKGGASNKVRDAEGVRVEDKSLFKKGVLKGLFHDLYTSDCLGGRGGNAESLIKHGYLNSNNLVIDSGSINKTDLLTDCIYINSLMGSHTANPITGDFGLNALNVFKISKDEWRPVRDVMVSGNIYQLLNQITDLSKETRFDNGLKTPLIKCEKVQLVS